MNKLKFKIVVTSLAVPIVWFILFVIDKIYPNFLFNSSISLGLMIGSLLRILIRRKYLVDLNVESGFVNITYINQFLLKKHTQLPMEKTIGCSYENGKWFDNYGQDVLECSDVKFYIMGTEYKNDIKNKLAELKILHPTESHGNNGACE